MRGLASLERVIPMSLSKPSVSQPQGLSETALTTKQTTNYMLDRFVTKHPSARVVKNSLVSWTVKMPQWYEVRLEIENDLLKFTLMSGMILQTNSTIPPKPEEGCVARLTTKTKEGRWNCKLYVKGQPFADGINFETGRTTHPCVFQFFLTPLEVREVLDDMYVWLYFQQAKRPSMDFSIRAD